MAGWGGVRWGAWRWFGVSHNFHLLSVCLLWSLTLKWLNWCFLSFLNNWPAIQDFMLFLRNSLLSIRIHFLKYIGAIFITSTTHRSTLTLCHRESSPPWKRIWTAEWTLTNCKLYVSWKSLFPTAAINLVYLFPMEGVVLVQFTAHPIHHAILKPFLSIMHPWPTTISYMSFLLPSLAQKTLLYLSGPFTCLLGSHECCFSCVWEFVLIEQTICSHYLDWIWSFIHRCLLHLQNTCHVYLSSQAYSTSLASFKK